MACKHARWILDAPEAGKPEVRSVCKSCGKVRYEKAHWTDEDEVNISKKLLGRTDPEPPILE